MAIDVFDKVKHLLTFNSEDDFYYLQILQRKKENPQLGSNSRVIKNYYIKSLPYLESRYDEIKKLCDIFNARAMLRLNKRSWKKVGFKALVNVSNTLSNQEYMFLPKSYDRAVGNSHNDKNKKWILDIDKDENLLDEDFKSFVRSVRDYISKLEPYGDKVIIELSTKNGVHLITSPFNLNKFKHDFVEVDVHKDNPINLYIP